MLDLESAILTSFAVDFDGPSFRLRIKLGIAFDGRFEPDVELHDFGVVFHPVCEFVLGSVCEGSIFSSTKQLRR